MTFRRPTLKSLDVILHYFARDRPQEKANTRQDNECVIENADHRNEVRDDIQRRSEIDRQHDRHAFRPD